MDSKKNVSNPRKKLGDAGERLAAEKLRQSGYRLVETNWRCRYGELDIVAWHGTTLVFVEVRTRRGEEYGTPEESVTPRKQQTLYTLGEAYLQAHPELLDERQEPPDCRFDLVAIQLDRGGKLVRLEVLENILEG